MKNKILSSFMLGLAIFAGTPGIAKTNFIPVTRENQNDYPFGRGWDSRKDQPRGYCVDNQADDGRTAPPSTGLASGSFDLRLQRDQKAVAEKLGISGSGRYRTGAVTTSASANLVKDMASNEFGISYTFVSEQLYRETMNPTRAFPIRVTKGFEGDVSNRDRFFKVCGDEYIQARNYAARVAVNINVSFVSRSERDQFMAEFGVNSPVLDLKGKIENESSKFSSANRMSIRAVQVGGDPAGIGGVLCPPGFDGHPDPDCAKNAVEVVNCGFGDIKKCTEVIKSAIQYTSAQSGNSFPMQTAKLTNYQVTSFETTPYVALGRPFVEPPSDQRMAAFEEATNMVAAVFDDQFNLMTFANQLYSGTAPRLSPRQKDGMEELRAKHFDYVEHSVQALDQCYDTANLETCKAAYGRIAAEIGINKKASVVKDQREAILALTGAEMFVQFCDIADAAHPAVRTTIMTLLAHAATQNKDRPELFTKGDKCWELAKWYEAQTELDLSKAEGEIEDLGPIAALRNLTTLNLVGKKIQSVRGLAGMTGLIELNLDNNRIEDVSPLTNLVNLRRLSLQDNRIGKTSMSKLSALDGPRGQLEKLDVRGNAEGLECPLKRAASCKVMSFADAANILSANTRCEETVQHQAVWLDSNRVLVAGGRAYPGDGVSAKIRIVTSAGCEPLASALVVPRMGHTMTNVDQGILVIGGNTTKIELIDRVSLKSRLLGGVLRENATNATATPLPDGRVLVVGGATDADPKFAMTNPSGLSGLVQIVSGDGAVEVVGRLSIPRAEHTATLLKNGKVLILGGYSLNKMLSLAEVIDPSTKKIETLKMQMPTGRMGHTAVLLENGQVLIAGGARWQDESAGPETQRIAVPVDQMVIFDPETNQFRILEERLSPARSNIQAQTMSDGRVLLIGGLTESKPTDVLALRVQAATTNIQVYDPRSEAVYQVATMLNARLGFSATAIGEDRVLVFGGRPVISVVSSGGGLARQGLLTSTELIVYRAR